MQKQQSDLIFLLGFIFSALIIVSLPASVVANKIKEDNHGYSVKAKFLYNFLEYIKPYREIKNQENNKKEKQKNICIIGKNNFGNNIKFFEENGIKTSHYKFYKSKNNIKSASLNCHLAFLKIPKKWVKQNLDILHKAGVLSVSDNMEFVKQGGIIEILDKNTGKKDIFGNRHFRFKLNLRSAKKSGLNIDIKLIDIATEVIR